MVYRRAESVLVLVHTAAQDVLLLKRKTEPCFWQSVTGALEDNESAMSAAHRELAEETGIVNTTLADCHYCSDFEISAPWRHRYAPGITTNTEHVFLCSLPARPPVITLAVDEHSEFRWLPVAEAVEAVWSHSNRAALEKFVINS